MKRILFGLLLIIWALPALAQDSPVSVPAYVKNKQWKNVRDFGAKGDGTTNDRAAIQAAIDALPDSGGVVFVPLSNSVYLIDATLYLPSHTSIIGSGEGATLKMSGAVTRTMIENADTTAGNTGIVIENLSLDGGKAYASYSEPDSADVVSFKNISKSTIRGCFIAGADKDAIAVRNGSTDVEISGNTLWANGEEGITASGLTTRRIIISNNKIAGQPIGYLFGGLIPSGVLCKASEVTIYGNVITAGGAAIDVNIEGGDTLRNIIISDNLFLRCNQTTVHLQEGYNTTVSGNSFVECAGRGVYTSSVSVQSQNITITGNSFYDQTDNAINAASGDHYVISDNLVYACDTTAIRVAGDFCTVTGNKVYGANGYGIHLESSHYSSVTGNVVSQTNGHGIYSEGASGGEYITIANNTIQKAEQNGIYLLSTDFSTISGNVCVNNDSLTSGTFAGIALNSCLHNDVRGNVCSSPNSTQAYGLLLTSSSKNLIIENYLAPNVTAGISGSTADIVKFNKTDTLAINDSLYVAGTSRLIGQVIFHNNVGIGAAITTPAGPLEIERASANIVLDATSGDPSIFFQEVGAGQWQIKHNATTDDFVLRRSGVADRFTVSTTGKITFTNYSLPTTTGTNGQIQKLQTTPTPDSLGWANDSCATDLDPDQLAGDATDNDKMEPGIIAQSGASTGQVLEWSGTAWAPNTDDGAGSGTQDSLSIFDGSTYYSILNNLLKIKEGAWLDIQREDSTDYDVMRFVVDSAAVRAYIAARFFGLADFDNNSIDTTASGQLEVKADGIDDTHIDFGTGANQVSTDDLTEGATNKYNVTHTGEVTGATSLTVAADVIDSTNIAASAISWSDIQHRLTRLPATDVYARSTLPAATDSLELHFGRFNGTAERWMVMNASSDVSTALNDSFEVGGSVDCTFDADSVGILYKVSGTGTTIDSLFFIHPSGDAAFAADSIRSVDVALTSTSWAYVAYPMDRDFKLAGSSWVARFRTNFNANAAGKVYIAKAWLIGKPKAY